MTTKLYSIDYQDSFLAHALCDTEFLKATIPSLEPEVFSNELAQRAVRLVKAHFERYHNAPGPMIIEVIGEWSKKGLLNEKLAGQITIYCKSLLELPRQHRQYLLERYDDFLQSRKLVQTLVKLKGLAEKEDLTEADKLLTSYFRERKQLTILKNGREGGEFSADPTERMLRRARHDETEQLWLLIPPLDRYNVCLERGHLLMFASQYTGAGKSTALAHTVKAGLVQSKKVLYMVIGEMTKAEVEDRLDQMIAGKPKQNLDTDLTLQRLLRNIFQFGGELRIECFSARSVTVRDLRDVAKELENTVSFKPDLIVIDYMDNIRAVRGESMHEEGKEIAVELKQWAQEDNVFMATALQGNTAGQEEVTADLKHAGGSRGKPEQADVYITINRTQKEKEENVMRLFVAKYRHGASAITASFKCDLERMQFYLHPVDGDLEAKPEPKKGKK